MPNITLISMPPIETPQLFKKSKKVKAYSEAVHRMRMSVYVCLCNIVGKVKCVCVRTCLPAFHTHFTETCVCLCYSKLVPCYLHLLCVCACLCAYFVFVKVLIIVGGEYKCTPCTAIHQPVK